MSMSCRLQRLGIHRPTLVRQFQIFVGPGPVRCLKIFKAYLNRSGYGLWIPGKDNDNSVKGSDKHGNDCVNIDECDTGHNTCHEYADCRDTDGSYDCKCKVGFTGDGLACDDVDECDDNNIFGGVNDCDANEMCRNTLGSFYCDCEIGYKTGENLIDCIDRDECIDGTATCDINSICRNTVGSYICECKTGWQSANGDKTIPGGGGHKCYDVDECKSNENLHHGHDFCAQQCENTEGSYTCGCDIGFINRDGQGRVCVDIGTEINTNCCALLCTALEINTLLGYKPCKNAILRK